MGQIVEVAEQKTATPGVIRFVTNRPLTGMGHRSYESAADWRKVEDPADELAKRFFEHGGVERIHIHGNVVTVDLDKGHSGEGLLDIVRSLFTFYED